MGISSPCGLSRFSGKEHLNKKSKESGSGQFYLMALPNHSSDTLPACAPGEVSQVVEDDLEEGEYVVVRPPMALGIGCPGEIESECLSFDIARSQKAPFPDSELVHSEMILWCSGRPRIQALPCLNILKCSRCLQSEEWTNGSNWV